MSNIKVINLFFTFFGLVKSSQPSPEPQGLFLPADHQILATIDAVFTTLKIEENFTKSKNMAHYMSLNNFVKDTLEKNEKMYQNISINCKSTSSSKTRVKISNIDKVIGEMIRMQKVKISKHLFNNNSNSRNTSHNRIVIEFFKLAKGFHLTLNTPSPYDLLGLRPSKKWPEREARGAASRRIFNGTTAGVARYPFMASLHVLGRFVCAGSLVRADLLITAASPLITSISPQSDPRSVKARVGSDYTNKFGKLVPVAGVHFHPKFNWTTLRCNLAVIQLKKRLKLEHGKIIAIQYDTTADYLPADLKQILILGWGEKKPLSERGYKYDASDQELSSARLELQNLKKCKDSYSRTYVSNKHFCASSDSHGGGACQFDVGGPAVAGRMLVGVASFGAARCGQRDAPTVFTKLGFYADWIKSVFKENPPKIKHNLRNAHSINIPDSDEVHADEKQFYHRLVRTGLQSAREKVLKDLVYSLEYEDDTFKKTTKRNPSTHLNRDVFLDPKLVPTLPRFPGFVVNYEYQTLRYNLTTLNTYHLTTPTPKLTADPNWVVATTESDYQDTVNIQPRSTASTLNSASTLSSASTPFTASTPSTASTLSSANTPSTTTPESDEPAVPFTRMGESFNDRSYE